MNAVALSSWMSFYNQAVERLRNPLVVVSTIVLLLHALIGLVMQLDIIAVHTIRPVQRHIAIHEVMAVQPKPAARTHQEAVSQAPTPAIQASKKSVKKVAKRAAKPQAKARAQPAKVTPHHDEGARQEAVARLKNSLKSLDSNKATTPPQPEMVQQASSGDSCVRMGRLSGYLASLVILPEHGETVLRLKISSEGIITDIATISAHSKANLATLRDTLLRTQLPRSVWQRGDPEELVVTLVTN